MCCNSKTESFRWPQGIGSAELFLVVDRNKAFEHRRSYLKPTIHVIDVEGNTVFNSEASELQGKTRLRGRTLIYTAGVADLNGPNNYRAVATLSDELAAPEKMEVHLELRQLRVPLRLLTIVGFTLFGLGVGGLLLTRPK